MKWSILFVVFNICENVFSQNKSITQDYLVKKNMIIDKEPDFLQDLSYKELDSLFKKNKKDTLLANKYANTYISKAKLENNYTELANGYDLFWDYKSHDLGLKYLDSIILITKDSKNHKFPAIAYLKKGALFCKIEKNKKALENFLIAQDYAQKNNNKRQLIAIKHNIAMLKKAVGGKKEALPIFRENLEFIKDQDTIDKYLGSYILTLYGIADSYHRLQMPDSAFKYVNLGLKKSYFHKEKYYYNTFLMLSGINNNLLGKPEKALDSLTKMENRIKDKKGSTLNLHICYIQIAKAYFKINKVKEGVKYLNKIDSLIGPHNYAPENRDAFELLISHFKKQGDLKNQVRVMSKLITMDSLFNVKNRTISADIVEKYETVQLIRDRDTVIETLEKDQKWFQFGLWSLIGFSAALIILVINYYRKQRIYRHRFHQLMRNRELNVQKNLNTEEVKSDIIDENDKYLSEELTLQILKKLKDFEAEKGFLDPTIKMAGLAKKINTNSSYLSKIINLHMDKNFVNYINDLRIEYSISRLQSDAKFRKYTIKSISAESGFNSSQSFSRAFYKNTGIYPSYFIKKIEVSL
ncbi:helix-turn-helix domain-containing protein [Aquimarina sp. 2201CG1-2-11]|uniref:helix-turn-helix domain-containing protein n=1 Tax=Aquimarina discodermiae TaxID=3231043 RepID=UPI0034631EBE